MAPMRRPPLCQKPGTRASAWRRIDLRGVRSHVVTVDRPSVTFGVFAILRSRAWRPLLLAFAVLAAWLRVLASVPAAAHVAMPASAMCLPSGAGAGADVSQGPGAADAGAESCAACRLPEFPAVLPPPAPQSAVVLAPGVVGLVLRPRSGPVLASPLPPSRAPPSVA